MSLFQPPEARVLADFAGEWVLTRNIEPKAGPPARFLGTALWMPENGGLAYEEKGVMRIDGQKPMQAERRYFWAEDLSVHFDDGRFFHRVPAWGGETDHWCDPDSYHGTYDFSSWPDFRVIWEVSGPRKAYRSVSEYRRGQHKKPCVRPGAAAFMSQDH